MTKELYKEIDLIISDLIKKDFIVTNKETSKLYDQGISFLKSNGLIKIERHNNRYVANSEDIYDINKIGIKQYLENKEFDKKLDSDIKEKTLFDLNNKHFINFIFLVFGAFLGWFLTNISESNKETPNIEKLHKAISEKNDSLIQTQHHLNEKNKIIISLKTEIDSVKK